jgi:hypothetical protein
MQQYKGLTAGNILCSVTSEWASMIQYITVKNIQQCKEVSSNCQELIRYCFDQVSTIRKEHKLPFIDQRT